VERRERECRSARGSGRSLGPHHLTGWAPMPASPAPPAAPGPIGAIGSDGGRHAGAATLGARGGVRPRPPPRAAVAQVAAVAATPSGKALGGGHAARAAEVTAAARGGVLVAEVAPERDAPAPGVVGVLDHGAQTPRVLAAQDLEAAPVEEEDTARAVAVTPGAPGLLQVALERGRRLVVDDVADVRLVDAETEGAGRHHDDPLALLHEARLVLGALLVGHLAMV